MKSTNIYLQQQKIRLSIEKTFPDFLKLKKEGDQISFNKHLLKILPEVKKYVNQRLVAAIKKEDFSTLVQPLHTTIIVYPSMLTID